MDERRLDRMYRQARAERWGLPREEFRRAVERAAGHGVAESTHLEDLALACACAAGIEAAWEHFVRELRPVLYRAADALDPSGGAREIADELYADLYGLRERNGERLSLFRYYHGRSSLATWLRAVLAQRVVDRVRRERRFDPLPDPDAPDRRAAPASIDPDRPRFVAAIMRALSAALAALPARDRLRLACYYQQSLTLAQIGRLLKEHEATVSRHLTRTRRGIRADVEARLRADGLAAAEIDRCFELLLEDVEDTDLARLLDAPGGKNSDPERSI